MKAISPSRDATPSEEVSTLQEPAGLRSVGGPGMLLKTD